MRRHRYKTEERLGGGGMAEVFKGWVEGAEGFRRPIALKRILPGLSSDESFCEMFIREAKIASLLTHPNIASVIDFDRDEDGQLFIVMELVDGYDVRTIMKHGALPPPVAIQIASDLLRALSYAHQLQHDGVPMEIVHRDVTPHNIIVSRDGTTKLTDFGIAKAAANSPLTRTGVIKGKTTYLSPEQASADPLDGRSDLFAVGIVLHEMLTGRRLFAGANDAVIMHNIVCVDAPLVSDFVEVSPALVEAVRTLLARSRNDRYETANDALTALLDCPEISPRGPLVVREELDARLGRASVHVPDAPPLGDFTGLAPVSQEPSDLDVPTRSDGGVTDVDEPTRVEEPEFLTPTALEPSPLELPRLAVFAPTLEPVSPPQRSVGVVALSMVVVAAAMLGLGAWLQLQSDVAATQVEPAPQDEPEMPVTVQPRSVTLPSVVAPATERRTAEAPALDKRALRRARPARAPVVAEPPPPVATDVVRRDVVVQRVRRLGDRIRSVGRTLPEATAAAIDMRYLDLQSATKRAGASADWSELDRQAKALELSLDRAERQK